MKLFKALLPLPILAISTLSMLSWHSTDVYAAAPQIRITEIMYDPLGNGDKEFIEIYNGSDTTASLAGWSFSNGVNYTFSSGASLEPGKYGVVVRNSSIFRGAYPSARVFGQYIGKLLGGGELIRLVDKNGSGVTQVDYRSGGAWPSTTRNGGPSLSLIKATGDETSPSCWGSSTANGGSPGFTNSTTGGGSCPNKSYLTSPPPPQNNPSPSNTPQNNPSGGTQSQGGGTSNGQNTPASENQTQDSSDQTIKDLSAEELAVLEEQGKLEDSEDGAEVTKLGAADPVPKKILGLVLGCAIIFLGVGYVVFEKLIKHKNKHPVYSNLNKKLNNLIAKIKKKF